MERRFDHLMKRTEHRPIPSGRISPPAAAVFGIVTSLVGVWILWHFFGSLPGILGLVTLGIYLGLYTPLKRRSPWNTLIGAFPGALPTLIGWSAAEGRITLGGWMIFTILFLWQFPHFFSLAWMYRKDYARAGYKMLPVIDDEQGTRTNAANILSVIGLLIVTSSMTAVGITGPLFFGSSLVLGMGFLWAVLSVRAVQRKDTSSGRYPRRLFFASLAYLPLVLVLGLLDKVR
jgi:protoheme IX farnesyltransferase